MANASVTDPPRLEALERWLADRLHTVELPWEGSHATPRRAVVGVDGGEQSLAAARWAGALADHVDLVAALGQDVPRFVAPRGEDPFEPWYERALRGAREVLEALEVELEGVEVEGHVVEASAAGAIVEAAREGGADLVAVGHSTRARLSRWVLGSVAEAVVHGWEKATLVARDPPDGGPVVLALGEDKSAPVAAGWACRLAARFGSPLVVARSAPEGYAPGGFRDEGEDVGARSVTVDWPPEEHVPQLAEELAASLLVLGHGHRPGWLGSTAIGILRGAPSNVLVAR